MARLSSAFAMSLLMALALAENQYGSWSMSSMSAAAGGHATASSAPWPTSGTASGGTDTWDSSGSSNWAGETNYSYYIPSDIDAVMIAHALIGSIAVLGVLPFGAIFVRLFGEYHRHGFFLHGGIQVLGLMLYAIAAGMGFWMGTVFGAFGNDPYLKPKLYHPIIGTLLLLFLILQPFSELAVFLLRKEDVNIEARNPKVRWLQYFHLWFGRFLIVLGMINGGLGFAFADQLPGQTWSKAPRIVYSVVATVVGAIYVVVVSVWPQGISRRNGNASANGEEMVGLSEHAGQGHSEERPHTVETQKTEGTVAGEGEAKGGAGGFRSTAL